MNMIVSENFAELRKNPEQSAEVSRLTQQWEKKLARHGKQATGLGMVAFSLAACGGGGGGSTPTVTPPPPVPAGGKIFLLNADNTFLIDPAFWPTSFGSGPAVAEFFANITSRAGLNLTPTSTGQQTSAGDDHIIGTSGQVNSGYIDGGAGDDILEINVITEVVRFGSENVETLILSNGTNGSNVSSAEVDLFAVFDLDTLVIDQGNNSAGVLNVVNVRSNPDLEFTGHFSAEVRIEMLGGIPALNVSLTDVTANTTFVFAHEGGTVNLTSQGATAVNIVDEADFGDYLRTLNISGSTALELGREGGGVVFRATSEAVIDAADASGGVWIRVAPHTNIAFTGGDGDDSLSVAPGTVAVSNEDMVTLTADFGDGDNELIIDGQGGFLGSETVIVSGGTLALYVTSDLDVTRVADLSAIDEVYVVSGNLTMEMAQVDQIGIDAFQTNAAGATTGALVITNIQDGALIDLSAINVNTLVELVVGPGDVTLDPASVLGNANEGVGEITIDVRGQDSSLTLTGAQFNQLAGDGTIRSNSTADGTNNPSTGQPYTGALTLVDVAPDAAINLGDVAVDTTVVLGDGFTAGSAFDILNVNADVTLSLSVSGAVDLSAAGSLGDVGTVTLADGASLTINNGQADNFDDEYVFEGAATLVGDRVIDLDTDAVEGLSSSVDLVLAGEGDGFINLWGNAGAELGTLTTGADISAIDIDTDGEVTFAGLVAQSAGHLTIVADAGSDGALDLGMLSATAQTVELEGTGDVSVELATIPAGAAWTFKNTELVINSVDGFGAGASIHLDTGTTLALGDGVTIAEVVPFLTSTSLVPLDATSSAEDLAAALDAMSGAQATIDVTGMTVAQLQAITDNHLKVSAINGDLAVSSALTDVQITRLATFDNDTVVATIDATGMSAAQKAASADLAGSVDSYTVTGLSLGKDDVESTIDMLMGGSANASVAVNAADMDDQQKSAIEAWIEKVAVDGLTNLTVDGNDSSTTITALLSKAPDASVTVDEAGPALDQDDFTAIYEQIDTVKEIVNWEIIAGETEHIEEFQALLPLAVEASVVATNMSNEELSAIAANIGSIKDAGISNLTVSADQTAAEIGALLSKTPEGAAANAQVDLSDMSADQVAAVVANATHVAGVTVGVDSEVTLTLEQLATLDTAGLTPIIGADATATAETGGSITIVAAASGTLDLGLVGAGGNSGGPDDDNGGTLTLDVPAGMTLTLVGGAVDAENLAITGKGTVVISESLDLSGLNLTVDGDITLTLPAAAPADQVELTLSPEQADALAEDGVTINRPAGTAPAVAGIVVASGGNSATPADAQDLSDLNLSLIDELTLTDLDGTILSSDIADLPAEVSGNKILVTTNTDWTGYAGEISADITVASDATLTISAAAAAKMTGVITGDPAAAAGETGGSIVITDLPTTEIDLSTFSAAAGGAGAGTAGTFTVLVDANVTLHEDTQLPSTATVVVNSGITLTVQALDSAHAASSLASEDYTGGGTVKYVGLNDGAGTAVIDLSDAVRFSTVVFESTDDAVVINGWESITVGGFDGRFLFDSSTDPDTLGLHSLDLSKFNSSGDDVVNVANIGALNLSVGPNANAGVVILAAGETVVGGETVTGAGAGDKLFFVFEDGANTEIHFWNNINGDTAIDGGELTLIATLNNVDAAQLGSDNFIL